MKKRLLIVLLAGAVATGAFYLTACAGGADDAPAAIGEDGAADGLEALRRVQVATVEAAEARRTIRLSGVTRAVRRARLAFPFGGRLVARPVEIGDRVAAGAEVARLEDFELRNEADEARASLGELETRRAQAERDRARVAGLLDGGAATAEELERETAAVDALEAAERAAAARLRERERLHGNARLLAPFAGTVTEVALEPGERAAGGATVVTLAGDGAVEVEVEVPEALVARLSPGDEARVALPALGRTATGRISSVARTAGGPGRLFPVVVALEGAGLASGMTAEVELALAAGASDGAVEGGVDGSAESVSVPVDSVVDPAGRRPAVFRLRPAPAGEAATVEAVAVEVGALRGDRVAVRGALRPGDRVVVAGLRGLTDGERVEVAGVTP